ncbi:hypothetical protein [Leuconostoc citreum]|uniref:hypothetical protein n=1 Tax=Leuconostoc citreum TaxID=33964 RepID=UPI0032DE7B6A
MAKKNLTNMLIENISNPADSYSKTNHVLGLMRERDIRRLLISKNTNFFRVLSDDDVTVDVKNNVVILNSKRILVGCLVNTISIFYLYLKFNLCLLVLSLFMAFNLEMFNLFEIGLTFFGMFTIVFSLLLVNSIHKFFDYRKMLLFNKENKFDVNDET